jgi:hypothetical protein
MNSIVNNLEICSGERHYYEALKLLHNNLKPDLYMEIGVRNAGSLKLANGPAIGIDPAKQFDIELPSTTLFFEMTSDNFFEEANLNGDAINVDFSFIDGMHLFEHALRDFINIEKLANPWSIIIFDDVCPNHPIQASRSRQTKVWTGDVWKIRDCLKRYRPDIIQIVLNTWPSGLLIVMGLDKTNTTLIDNYNKIINEYVNDDIEVTNNALKRLDAITPSDEVIISIANLANKIKTSSKPIEDMNSLRHLMQWKIL